MYTAARIRRHINNLTDDKPFSIRDFLNYGLRGAVDQVFFRLTKSREIIRVARGLYIKCGVAMPSILEVATVKAAAFGRKIVIHGMEAACQLELSCKTIQGPVYACSGRTSSFRFGDIRIHFKGVSSRKLHLRDTVPGLAVRALWHLGKIACDTQLASRALLKFNRLDREILKQSARAMPSWMCDLISFMGR